jgi:hypothetical protein
MNKEKEKAIELIYKFGIDTSLKVIDEIVQSLKFTEVSGNLRYIGYWNDVREEIETFKQQEK